ncbi:TFIIE alpha subunit-domain-containing protein [Melampsora americana]|nr:TFIIE alpha subunit-domain-containing protein [Melampsora americana]
MSHTSSTASPIQAGPSSIMSGNVSIGQNHTDGTQKSDENVDTLADIRLLLQYVSRAFYEVRHILLLDQLIRKEAMKDEELAARLGVGPKELAKAANMLIRDQLVSVYLRAEVKPGASKATQRTYYYIDYKHCVDVIKWRLWKISKVLDDKQRNVIDGQGYLCPRCKTTYSTLDISGLAMTAMSFLCEICNTPLDDNDNDIEVQKNKDRMQRLNSQSTLIKKTLQKADKVVVPAFDIAQWVAVHMPLEKKVDSTDGLAVATGGAKEAAVSVQMAQEGDLETKRLLKEQQAEAKRQANALPVWIAQSTVSGELTGAGIKEGTNTTARPGISFVNPTAPEPVDVKIDGDVDYDAYFAKLQNQSRSLTTSDPKRSPSDSTSSLNSPSQSCSSSTGTGIKRNHDFVDEGYGSLKSSPEDHRTHGNQPRKKTKLAAQPVPLAPPPAGDDSDEVKTMLLGGKLIDISSVTEEMEHHMTPEEYTIYATLIMAN